MCKGWLEVQYLYFPIIQSLGGILGMIGNKMFLMVPTTKVYLFSNINYTECILKQSLGSEKEVAMCGKIPN